MPCSCFGKKDKKGGVLVGGEEDRYRPRDSREREPLAPILPPVSVAPITPTQVQQSQTQPLLGAAPSAPGTPPSTPVATPNTPGGDARLRPEDDPDKATRRRDVVASFYSDQCELIGFKATGSRPPSSHVGSIQDGPAATSSPAASSPSSTRSGGALCRSDLAEKRREFFRDLTLEDEERGSRPTSRLTDPGSQQTPRHSHYQDQLHHTLPHQNKTSPRSNKLANNPFIIQQGINRSANTSPTATQEDYSADTEPLLLHSSPQQAPKISLKKSDNSVSKVPKHLSSEISHEPYFNDEFSEDAPLLSEKQTPLETQHLRDSYVSTKGQQVSPEISFRSTDQSSLESKLIFDTSELNSPELLVDMTPTENSDLIINTTPVKHPELNVVFPTEPTKSSQLLVDTPSVEFPELIVKSPTQNSKLIEDFLSKNNSQVSFDVSASYSPQFIVDVPNTESEQLLVNKSVQESPQDADHIALDSQLVLNNTPLISSTPKVEPFIQQDIQTPTRESYSVESPPQFVDKNVDIEFSHEPLPQTLPVIINETLKEPHKDQSDHTFVITPHNTHMFSVDSPEEQTPQTFVETTRQFISSSPDEQKTSQTIVETTRQFITGPPEEEPTKTIVETTQQYISEIPEEQKTTTVVETTRRFISGIPDDDEVTHNLMETAQQFLSGSPDEQTTQTIVKTTQHFVTGSPDEQLTQTVVQTTKQFVSGSPDEQITTQTIESTQQQSLPPSVDPFFLTSAEEPDELPGKLLLQSAAPTVTQTGDKPVPMPRIQFTEVETLKEEVVVEEPKLPDVPCFGAPPPPASPPPPLPEENEEEESTEMAVTFPVAVAMSPGKEEEPLPPAPPTPPAEHDVHAPRPSAPLLDQQQILQFETEPVPHTPPTPPTTHGDNEDLPPAPPTPPTPRLDDVQLPSTPPMENELLPPTPPTPHREDELPPAPLTPPTMHKPLPPAPPIPPKSSSPHLPPVTCGVEIVSSSTLEDDGIGSEIDDALESLEGLSEEGKKIERAAASS